MKKQVIVIHGGGTYSSYEMYLTDLREIEVDLASLGDKKRWRHSLGEKLGDGYEVILPSMPNDMNAKYLEWKIWFDKLVPQFQDGVILVGHSLGGLFLAKYLSENKMPKSVRATFLVAAPFDDADTLSGSKESVADFALPASLVLFAEQGGDIYLYHSEDDFVVAFADMEKYARLLPRAVKRVFKDHGHFLIPELPEIVEDIQKL